MPFKIFLFILITSVCYSQSIIWEREYDLVNEPLALSFLPTMIDSDGNVITALDPGIVPFMNAGFIKYETSGNLLSFKKYFTGNMLLPVSLYQSENGYKMLCATNYNYDSYENSIPFIFNILKNGDSTGIEYPYDIYNDKFYDSVSFKINTTPNANNNNTISINNKFFNATLKENIKIDSVTFIKNNHLLISCYDSLGKLIWRKGIDTLGNNDKYYFSDLKITNDNNILILSFKFIDNNDFRIQIIEVDKDGNITKKIEVPVNDEPFNPKGIVQMDNREYIIIGQKISNARYIFVKINDTGEIIKKVDIPKKNSGVFFFGLLKTPKGNIIANGYTITDTSGGFYNYKHKILLYQVNRDLDFISDFEFQEYNQFTKSGIRHLHFIDSDNFIGIGYKDIYKFYIAKFKDTTLTNVPDKNLDNFELIINPNPSSDYLNIISSNTFYKVEIFSALGIKVYESEYKDRIDVSRLSSGVYFVKIADRVVRFVKI